MRAPAMNNGRRQGGDEGPDGAVGMAGGAARRGAARLRRWRARWHEGRCGPVVVG
jgi:hypothetical protein